MATLRRFMALLLVVLRLTRDLAGKPGPTFPDRAQKPGILFSFEHDLFGKPVSTFPDHAQGALRPQKGSPAKRTGHTLRVAAQYIQKTSKNNGLFGIWLAEFRVAGPLNCPCRGRDRPPAKPPQNGLSPPHCTGRTCAAAHPGCGPGSSRGGS